MTEHALLCLKCRGSGHCVEKCPAKDWQPELDWFFSPARRSFNSRVNGSSDEVICSRCDSLNLVQLLESRPPWDSQTELSNAFETQYSSFTRSLGLTGSLQFWTDCSVCRCIFAITPNPSSLEQEVFLVPDWTISRVLGELGVVTFDNPVKREYATCLVSALHPSSISLPTQIVAHRGDALCLLENDIGPEHTLGGRQLDSDEMNVNMVLDWVQACMDRHDESCTPVPTEDLEQVRFVDVEARQVVRYPGPDCEYIALSYVWGEISQDHYRLGETLNALPRTLEDALLFTRKLGKKYIWVDSLCIDQSNERDKSNQINRMWAIYRGAWITVVALSGTSAKAGLSRLSRPQVYAQLECYINGKSLVSLMPTLSQQIWVTAWGQRAWTLQEGLLSPRCLYLGDHQIYFDCSSMQCCESLNETRSWAHKLTPSRNPTEEGFVTWMLRQAGAGALRIPLDWPSRRLEHWGEKLNLYSYRSMKYSEDAIRAFDGVLQRLETIYPQGFFWGLPVDDFDWALLWRSQMPPLRRKGFPTWSWAGWRGALFFGQPIDVKETRRITTELEICAVKSKQMQRIFAVKGDRAAGGEGIRITIRNDPIDLAAQIEVAEAQFQLGEFPAAESDGYLFITAIILRFQPDFSKPRTGAQQAGAYETFAFKVRHVQCLIRITSTDRHIPGYWDGDRWIIEQEEQSIWTLMLIARDHIQGFILHHLMLIKMQDQSGIAERATVLELLIPLDELDVLKIFQPQKRRIVLA